MRNIETREGYDLWDKANKLPRFNFWRGGDDEKGSVIRVQEKHGNWVEHHEVQKLADEYQDEINSLRDQLRAVLAQEAGKCEPVAWAYKREGGEVLGQLVQMESDDLKGIRLGKCYDNGTRYMWPREDYIEWEPLYKSPPAPVSVVRDEQQEFANWMHEVVQFEHAGITRKIQRRDIMDLKDEKAAWEAWQARACLDKVKELNQ